MLPRAELEPRTACILIVEDDFLIRFSLASELRDRGVSVIETDSSDEALALLLDGMQIDLVFTDYLLSGSSMTGAQLAARIKDQFPAVKVLVTSGDFHDTSVWSGPVVKKPYVLDEIATRLVELSGSSEHRKRDE